MSFRRLFRHLSAAASRLNAREARESGRKESAQNCRFLPLQTLALRARRRQNACEVPRGMSRRLDLPAAAPLFARRRASLWPRIAPGLCGRASAESSITLLLVNRRPAVLALFDFPPRAFRPPFLTLRRLYHIRLGLSNLPSARKSAPFPGRRSAIRNGQAYFG